MKPLTRRLCIAGALLWAALAVPPVRHALESTMTLQMLLQIPLLALAGGWFAQGAPEGLDRRLAGWNQSGISGLLLASLAGMVWMLPLAMDAALDGLIRLKQRRCQRRRRLFSQMEPDLHERACQSQGAIGCGNDQIVANDLSFTTQLLIRLLTGWQIEKRIAEHRGNPVHEIVVTRNMHKLMGNNGLQFALVEMFQHPLR